MISQPLGEIDCHGISEKHPRFERNSDRFVIADVRPSLRIHASTDSNLSQCANLFGDSQGQLLVLADGVGERLSAARASALATDTVNSHLLNAANIPSPDSDVDEPDLFHEFELAIDECRSAMRREVDAADRFDAMGAVLTLVYISWPSAYVMHVGNNRVYHSQRRSVYQVTKDHTMARRLVDAGQLSPNRAETSDLRNVIWNLIGTQTDETVPEVTKIELSIGDAIVLCSDGLTDALAISDIGRALEGTASADQSCQQLLGVAKQRGLTDDATIVVARFLKKQPPEADVAAEEVPNESKSVRV